MICYHEKVSVGMSKISAGFACHCGNWVDDSGKQTGGSDCFLPKGSYDLSGMYRSRVRIGYEAYTYMDPGNLDRADQWVCVRISEGHPVSRQIEKIMCPRIELLFLSGRSGLLPDRCPAVRAW